jgi:hypothetical protein
MNENLRLFFSILWLGSVGFSVAFGLAVIVSWGGYLEYFLAAVILAAIATAGAFVTSL